jgi:hypothetical protein
MCGGCALVRTQGEQLGRVRGLDSGDPTRLRQEVCAWLDTVVVARIF